MSSFFHFISFLALSVLVFCIFPVLSTGNGRDTNDVAQEENTREGKGMFNLNPFSFGVERRRCTSNQEEGVCYKRSDCTRYGGTPGDSCSGGVCCILKSSCLTNNTGEMITVRRNLTHLVEPTNYMVSNQCRFVIKKRTGVCQVRLDFKKFNLMPPTDGNCDSDVMTITGAANVPNLRLCGEAKDQHLYLDFGSSDSITISTNLDASTRVTSNYDVLVTMVPCNSPVKAPAGCAQYYRQTSGEIRSFNYMNGMQLNDQKYTACVQAFDGSTKIKWDKCSNTDTTPFFITGAPGVGAKAGADCTTDYVEIFGAGKFCGSDFSSVTSEAMPFIMYVNLNEEELLEPTTPLNPVSGCYEGWTCYTSNFVPKPCLPPPGVCTPCDPSAGDICVPPPYIADQSDTDNSGFCLRYMIS